MPNEDAIVRPWYNASSNDGSSCVDVQMRASGTVEVRNSKDTEGPIVRYTRDEWDAFINGAKNGKFDPVS